MQIINVENKTLRLVKGDIKYFKSSCILLDNIKQDFKDRQLDIYQEDYPNYDIIKSDLENREQTLLLVDENEVVYAQITSTPNELRSMFDEDEVLKILNFYNIEDLPYVGLCRLFVDKSLRSHGIGTYLINAMEEKYKGEKFIFFVHLTNKNAIKLYEYLGFKNLGIYTYVFGDYYTFIK